MIKLCDLLPKSAMKKLVIDKSTSTKYYLEISKTPA